MIDRNEIKACMARNGLRQKDVAQHLGITLTCFNLKMTNKRLFNEKEISSLVSILGKGILILE
jgi:hypothetical protein